MTRFVQLVTQRCVCQGRDSRKGLCVSPAHPVGAGKSGSRPAHSNNPLTTSDTPSLRLKGRELSKQAAKKHREDGYCHGCSHAKRIWSTTGTARKVVQVSMCASVRVWVCVSPCDDSGLSLSLRCKLFRRGKLTDSLDASCERGGSFRTNTIKSSAVQG